MTQGIDLHWSAHQQPEGVFDLAYYTGFWPTQNQKIIFNGLKNKTTTITFKIDANVSKLP